MLGSGHNTPSFRPQRCHFAGRERPRGREILTNIYVCSIMYIVGITYLGSTLIILARPRAARFQTTTTGLPLSGEEP